MKVGLRLTSGTMIGVVTLAIGTALFLQKVLYLEPCPLCIAQRVLFVLTAIAVAPVLLSGTVRSALWALPFTFLGLIIGWSLAARHVWITYFPPEDIPGCLPGLEYLLDTLALGEALNYLVIGTADCLEDNWSLFGLSIPEYSLLLFTLLFILTCRLLRLALVQRQAGRQAERSIY